MSGVRQRVLITGGTGFLGSHLARSYVERGATVRIVGRSRGPLPDVRGLSGRLEFVECDVARLTHGADDAFAAQDLVIHAAAQIRARNLDERVTQYRTNVDGTRHVVRACRQHRVGRLVYVSTCAAVGIPQAPDNSADEQFAFNLEHLDQGYALTKRAAEQVALEANGATLETMVVSPGFIFGWDGDRFRGREVIERVLRRRLVFCTDGGLSIVHVDDVVAGIRAVAERGRPGERYILAGENATFRQIAETVARVAHQRRIVVPVPNGVIGVAGDVLGRIPVRPAAAIAARLGMLRRYSRQFYSSDKARRELGYEPRSLASIVDEFFRPPITAPSGG